MGDIEELCFNYEKNGFLLGFIFAICNTKKQLNAFDKIIKEDSFLLRVKEEALKEIEKAFNSS